MKRENLAILIAFIAFGFWIAENFYFGWNITAQSGPERFCDTLALFLIFISYLVKPSSNDVDVYITNLDKMEVSGQAILDGKKK